MGLGTKRQERFKKSKGFIQKNNPFPVTSCGRRRTFMHDESKKSPFSYKPPKQKHFADRNPHSTQYNPETQTIEWGGGTVGVLGRDALDRMERHETKHHHQATVNGIDLREKFFEDREKYIQEQLKKHNIKNEDHELDLREDYASRFRTEQYKTPGTTEYEARKAEDKFSPGLYRKQ